jgi:hypothetical protein
MTKLHTIGWKINFCEPVELALTKQKMMRIKEWATQ